MHVEKRPDMAIATAVSTTDQTTVPAAAVATATYTPPRPYAETGPDSLNPDPSAPKCPALFLSPYPVPPSALTPGEPDGKYGTCGATTGKY
jgi:hypothetical protein